MRFLERHRGAVVAAAEREACRKAGEDGAKVGRFVLPSSSPAVSIPSLLLAVCYIELGSPVRRHQDDAVKSVCGGLVGD